MFAHGPYLLDAYLDGAWDSLSVQAHPSLNDTTQSYPLDILVFSREGDLLDFFFIENYYGLVVEIYIPKRLSRYFLDDRFFLTGGLEMSSDHSIFYIVTSYLINQTPGRNCATQWH